MKDLIKIILIAVCVLVVIYAVAFLAMFPALVIFGDVPIWTAPLAIIIIAVGLYLGNKLWEKE